ncbi:amidohydrolase [Fulvivirga sp. RKSG066]|uniref:amidohydrolase n=1 Tax=Fulvivirga aurantia TaxID=2529383 RepID=UPI0012BCA910|nr:amidohydrolase family protein [Fulvivirga aurantia]MTI20991.1 amidohydrolase [Fulvivirga aurantia]
MTDYLITNCQIYRPFQPSDSKFYQVRIRDEKIVSIEENGATLGDNKIKKFDAKGRTLAPSFKDSHIHFLRYSLMKNERDLRRISKWKHLKEELKNQNEKEALKHNEWLVGRGLMDDSFTDRDTLLTAKDLDSLNIDHPIFLLHQDGHECVLNTQALDLLDKEALRKKTLEEFIEKDESGNWNGRFKDTAVHFIKMNFRNKSTQQAEEALRDGLPHIAEVGITHIDSDDLNYVGDYAKVWKAYSKIDKDGELTCDAYLHHYVYDIDDMKYYLKNFDKRTGDGEGHVRVGAFKIFVDGTYRLHTAAMNLPYVDSGDCGTLIYDQEILNKMLQLAEDNNMQVAMHCIGDRAVETAAKAIINANPNESNPLRHRIIHMQNTRWDLLSLISKAKIPIETQPGFLIKEYDNYKEWLGEDREKLVQVGQSLVDNDVIFSASSDAPIGPLNPLEHIYASANRTNYQGEPKGGWQPQEIMSVDHAFESYCATPTYINHSDSYTGRLLPGYNADLILLEEHPNECPKEELHNLKVDNVWHRGKLVYDRYN